MYSSYPSYVFGFHGLDESIGKDLISGNKQFIPSENSYDWLGSGIYFWENNYIRAKQWANEQSQRAVTSVKTPFVVGAIIDLGNCFDLLNQQWLDYLAVQYEFFKSNLEAENKPLPTNRGFGKYDFDFKCRELDCAVISYAIEVARMEGMVFDSVRAAFWEGEALYPHAGFRKQNHIQICVLNPACIKGVFLPRQQDEQ